MSAGYLGKISALVTVNTTDIASKVQSGFAAPFENALRSIETTLRNTNKSVEKSFNDIYTSAQKQARAVAAAQMGAVKAFDGENFAKRMQIRDDIADPVKRLALEIEKTSGILRSNFEPRIVAIQAESQALFDRMATDASSVASGEITALIGKVNELGSSLSKASSMAGGFEKLSAIGRGDKGTRREDMMFAGLGAAVRRQAEERDLREAQAAAAEDEGRARRAAQFANLGAAGRAALGTGPMFATLGQRSRDAFANSPAGQQAAQDAIEQQQRIQAIREADEVAFRERQRQAAESIHAEEQAAIAAERSAREAGQREAQEAAEQELRVREVVRQRIHQEFQDRQRLIAETIHAEEQAAIAREADEREADGRRRAMLEENEARARDAAERVQQVDREAERSAAARLAGQVAENRRSGTDEFRESFGGRGASGINLGLDRGELAARAAEMGVLQRAIGRVAADARGPAVDAFVRLKNAIGDAFEAGTISQPAVRANIERLRTTAVRETAAAGGGSRQGLQQEVGRAGDIARNGLDKFGLALQQAGFAIDDFFSATGGLDQKIRAVSNNISQMAFILGGTAGLFAGMAVTIGSQAVVALMKYADAGRTSADRTKALNDAIQAQQSLVKGLSDAYKELSKSLSAAMSPGAQKKADRDRAFLDIGEKRLQANRENVFSSDTGVANARASVVVAEKALSGATTASGAKVAEMQVRIARQREEQAKEEALRRTARFNDFTGAGVGAGISTKAAIETAIGKFGDMRMRNMEPEDAARFREFIQAQQRAVPQSVDRQAAAAQLRGFIENEVRTNDILQNPGPISTDIMGELFEQLARLEFALNETNGALIDDVNRSLVGTADAIDNAKNTLDKAAMETQDVSALRTEIDRVAASLEALSLAAAETTDKDVLAAIAEDAAAAKELGDRLSGAARKAKEFADKLQEAITEENNAAARGVDLGKIRDQASQGEDIRAAAANIGNDAERNAFVARAFGNVVADTQTILKGFGQERENAILGGPSRAALNASDVSTMEGQQELNRLLRGDDPNRDVNFAEMKHQSELLQTIADRILAATGIAVEFR